VVKACNNCGSEVLFQDFVAKKFVDDDDDDDDDGKAGVQNLCLS